jgi:glycosyltransferase involved in cell wall biosynthesis
MSDVQSLGLQNDVIFLDTVSEDTLPNIYNIANIFVFPSYYEGFGLPPLESMACGTPVICSSATSLPEVVGDAAIIIDPKSSDQISNAIVQILTHADLLNDLSLRGIVRGKMFDWDHAAQQMSDVYKKVGESIKE